MESEYLVQKKLSTALQTAFEFAFAKIGKKPKFTCNPCCHYEAFLVAIEDCAEEFHENCADRGDHDNVLDAALAVYTNDISNMRRWLSAHSNVTQQNPASLCNTINTALYCALYIVKSVYIEICFTGQPDICAQVCDSVKNLMKILLEMQNLNSVMSLCLLMNPSTFMLEIMTKCKRYKVQNACFDQLGYEKNTRFLFARKRRRKTREKTKWIEWKNILFDRRKLAAARRRRILLGYVA